MSYSVNYYGTDGTVVKTDTFTGSELASIIEPEEILRLVDNSYIRVATDIRTAMEFGVKSMLIKALG